MLRDILKLVISGGDDGPVRMEWAVSVTFGLSDSTAELVSLALRVPELTRRINAVTEKINSLDHSPPSP